MIVIRLIGGLGNQMFQYAMGRRIAKDLGTSLKLDLSLLKPSKKENLAQRNYQLDIFNINESFLIQPKLLKVLYNLNLNFIVKIIYGIKLIGLKKVEEKTFTVEQYLIDNPTKNSLYSGYWQSESYFKSAEDILRKDFQFKDTLSPQAQVLSDKILSVNAVCVHMRRGDYVNNPDFNCSGLEYFHNSAKHIAESQENPHFFVFSDEPEWCKENVTLKYDFTVVDYQTNKIKFKEDLQLMSFCQHFIMSASSFSWWAVWLSNQKDNIVIAPDPWFLNHCNDVKDLVSKDWIRM